MPTFANDYSWHVLYYNIIYTVAIGEVDSVVSGTASSTKEEIVENRRRKISNRILESAKRKTTGETANVCRCGLRVTQRVPLLL